MFSVMRRTNAQLPVVPGRKRRVVRLPKNNVRIQVTVEVPNRQNAALPRVPRLLQRHPQKKVKRHRPVRYVDRKHF